VLVVEALPESLPHGGIRVGVRKGRGVPLRHFFEALGVKLAYDATTACSSTRCMGS
jgi:hypothetical protein